MLTIAAICAFGVVVFATKDHSPSGRQFAGSVVPVHSTCGTALALPFWKRASKSHAPFAGTASFVKVTGVPPPPSAVKVIERSATALVRFWSTMVEKPLPLPGTFFTA